MYLLLTSLVLSLICLHLFLNYNLKTRMISKVPSPKANFFVGHAYQIMLSPVDMFYWLRKLAAEFKGIYSLNAFSLTAVIIYNPEDTEIITSSMKYHTKGIAYRFLKPWLQDGLLVSNGSKWQNRRKILTSAFHFSVLRNYFTTMKDNNKILIEAITKTNENTVDIIPIISEYTLNTICETAMGTVISKNNTGAGNTYKEAIHGICKVVVERLLNLYLYPDFIFNLCPIKRKQDKYLASIYKFTKNVIQTRKQLIKEEKNQDINPLINEKDVNYSKIKRQAMLDLLISAQSDGLIDDVGIQEEVDTFMFEGHDTTAGVVIFILMLLANNPEIQDKVVEELNAIFGTDTRDPTIEDLAEMQYMDLCIKETLRLYPPVPFIMRKNLEPVQLSNYTIPANTYCCINIYDLHRNVSIYKDPNKFVPERFLPENSVGRHSYAYIPFSAGPRNCIGQKFAKTQIKSVISTILRKFKLVAVTKESDIRFKVDIVLRTTTPIYMKFVTRERNLN